MSRKFRPKQCPECKSYQTLRFVCSDGGLGVIRRDDHPVKLVGESSRPCPDFKMKQKEV